MIVWDVVCSAGLKEQQDAAMKNVMEQIFQDFCCLLLYQILGAPGRHRFDLLG